MKNSKMFLAAGLTFAVSLMAVASTSYALDAATNTLTVSSTTLGFDPLPHVAKFTQDGSGTVNDGLALNDNYSPINTPGAFTNTPDGCVGNNADFGWGNNCGGGNNAFTAPFHMGANSATGKIISDIDLNMIDGSTTITGEVNFCLNLGASCDSGNPGDVYAMATLSEFIVQSVDLGAGMGLSTVTLDNRDAGNAILFETVSTSEEVGAIAPREIPWSVDVDQTGLDAAPFQMASSGIFSYEVEATDMSATSAYRFDAAPCGNLGSGPGAGFGDSCWPPIGSFDLPGFDMTGQGLGNGESNFPGFF